MNTKIAAICLAAALMQAAGCSKVDVTLEKPKQTESALAAQNASGPMPQSVTQRIVEIDRLLSMPLTGQPGDADLRATLRAERAALSNPYAQTVARTQPAPIREQPAASRQIVIARDSQGDHEPHRISTLEAMTPSERERYYRELRIKNPRPVVPFYSR